jgi:hypothetical protein
MKNEEKREEKRPVVWNTPLMSPIIGAGNGKKRPLNESYIIY